MRLAFQPIKLAAYGGTLVCGVLLGILAMPIWRQGVMSLNQREYGLLVEQCDGAMRDHFQAKMTAANDPSEESGQKLYSAEVGLLICQDYDLYQKRLMQWGLREEELSQMRLKAIEARAKDLDEVIAIHEIRY